MSAMFRVALDGQTVQFRFQTLQFGGIRQIVESDLTVDVNARAAKAANGSDFADPAAVRTNIGAATTDEAIAALEDDGAAITADLDLAAAFPVSPSTMPFYGDSITFGFVNAAVDNVNCWRAKASTRRGKTSANYALSGGSICDITHYMTGTVGLSRHTVLDGDEAAALMLFNDQRFNGENASQIAAAQRALEAMVVYRTVPDAQKIFADDSRVTYTGTWSASPAKPGWVFASADGASVSASLEGSALYALVLQQTDFGATVGVLVDEGQPNSRYFEVDLSPTIGNGGALRWTTGGFPSGGPPYPDGSTPLTFQIHCIRVGGLSRGRHTIKLTKVAAGADKFLQFGMFASSGSASVGSARLYLGNTLRISPEGAAVTEPPGYDNFTEEGNRLHCKAIEDTVRILSGDGLDVRLVDANSAWDPVLVPAGDYIHPPIAGHASIANAFIRAMNLNLRTAAPTTATAAAGELIYTPVLAGSGVAGAHTYATQEGSYVLINGWCLARGVITLTDKDDTMSGYSYLSLPVEASALTAGTLGRMVNVTLDTGYFNFFLETIPGTSRAILRQNKSADEQTEVTQTNFADDSALSFSVAFPYTAA